MILPDIAALADSLPPGGRLFGLDVGEKTIGIAVGDPVLAVATPVETIRRTKVSTDAAALEALAAQHGVAGLVIGLPLNMNATEGPRAQSIRAFARNLLARRDWPIAFQDERLSTAAVTRTLLEADASRKRRAEVVDKLAAAYILQGALDRLRFLGGNP